MEAEKCFEVALDHYRKGNEILNNSVRIVIEEQSLHMARATAHFTAGILALGLGAAQDRAGPTPAR